MRSAQFSLREMLAATVACAILLGIATPLLRWLPFDRSIRLGVGLVAGVAAFALEVLPFAFRRQRFEAAAGKSLLQVGRLPPWACMIGACAVLLIVVIVAVLTLLISTALGAVDFAIMAAFAGSLFAQFLRGTRWPVLEICENGIILAEHGFVAWRQVRAYSWGAVGTPPRLVLWLQTGRDFIKIPPDKRDEVESLLVAHTERF